VITHLLDSDWLIDCINAKNNALDLVEPLIRNGQLATSVIVLAEIYDGLHRDSARDRKLAVENELLEGVPALGIDERLVPQFAALRADLRASGQIINDHDIWIAATALEHNLTLITRDKHFERITGLKRHV